MTIQQLLILLSFELVVVVLIAVCTYIKILPNSDILLLALGILIRGIFTTIANYQQTQQQKGSTMT